MLAIAIAVSTSGCINTGPIATEKHKQLMLSLLKEKYGEGFKVLTIKYDSSSGFSGGLAPGSGHYDAVCCPKSNEEILFKASVCKNGTMISSDDYPHAVVKHLVKEEVEKVISKYSDNYAVYVYFSPPSAFNCEDEEWGRSFLKTVSPFTKASDISIESYSEKYLETCFATVEIILCDEKYKSVEAIKKMLDSFEGSLYKMTVNINFYFTSKKKIDEINKMLTSPEFSSISYRNEINAMTNRILFCYGKKTNYTFEYNEKLSKLN